MKLMVLDEVPLLASVAKACHSLHEMCEEISMNIILSCTFGIHKGHTHMTCNQTTHINLTKLHSLFGIYMGQ